MCGTVSFLSIQSAVVVRTIARKGEKVVSLCEAKRLHVLQNCLWRHQHEVGRARMLRSKDLDLNSGSFIKYVTSC